MNAKNSSFFPLSGTQVPKKEKPTVYTRQIEQTKQLRDFYSSFFFSFLFVFAVISLAVWANTNTREEGTFCFPKRGVEFVHFSTWTNAVLWTFSLLHSSCLVSCFCAWVDCFGRPRAVEILCYSSSFSRGKKKHSKSSKLHVSYLVLVKFPKKQKFRRKIYTHTKNEHKLVGHFFYSSLFSPPLFIFGGEIFLIFLNFYHLLLTRNKLLPTAEQVN